MPQFDWTNAPGQILWLVIFFGLLYLILSQISLPRIAAVLEQRRNRVSIDQTRARDFAQQTEKTEKEYAQSLDAARNKALALVARTRSETAEKIAAREKLAQAEMEEKLANAEKKIAKTRQNIISSVEEIAREAALAVMGKIVSHPPRQAITRTVNHHSKQIIQSE